MPNTGNIIVHADAPGHRVDPRLYSQFAEHLGRCIYEGLWVGEDSDIPNDGGLRLDTLDALRRLELPVLRWPGGCFADNYHWADGVGPRDGRPSRHNLWWNQPEPNTFGTDEYVRLCRAIGTEPYVCLNVGSGTVEEARAWVEYCNSDQDTTLVGQRRANGHPEPYNVRYWGIGNENWGCGGNMRPEYYANLYRQYATYVRRTAGEGALLIACGSEPHQPDWDARFLDAMRGGLGLVDALALHIYVGWTTTDTDFSDEEYLTLLRGIDILDVNLSRATGLAQAYSTAGHSIGVVLDEWGTWHREATVATGLYQQNTMRDALFAAACFHMFHEHGERLWMTNMAQTVNVLQALVLTRGPELILTPTYHIYDLYRAHRGGSALPCDVTEAGVLKGEDDWERPAVSVSATRSVDGSELCLTVVNLDLSKEYSASVRAVGESGWRIEQARRLVGDDVRAHNTFEEPERVRPVDIQVEPGQDTLTFPPASVTLVMMVSL